MIDNFLRRFDSFFFTVWKKLTFWIRCHTRQDRFKYKILLNIRLVRIQHKFNESFFCSKQCGMIEVLISFFLWSSYSFLLSLKWFPFEYKKKHLTSVFVFQTVSWWSRFWFPFFFKSNRTWTQSSSSYSFLLTFKIGSRLNTRHV